MTGQNVTRYVRYESGGQTSYGVLDGDTVRQLDGEPFAGGAKQTGATAKLADVRLLLPVDPEVISKVICVVDNYPDPSAPADDKIRAQVPAPHPFISPKMQTSLITDGEAIEIPPESTSPHHEGGLVLIVGKEGRNLSIEEAPDHVFGVTVGNDVTETDWLWRIGGNNVPDRILAKANDTWGPLGNVIVSGIDYSDLAIETRLNGKVAAKGRTSEMINNVAALVHYVSHYCTLLPGDVIYTGSPVASHELGGIKPGDVVEVEIEGVGKLSNPVVVRKRTDENPWWLQLAAEAQAGSR